MINPFALGSALLLSWTAEAESPSNPSHLMPSATAAAAPFMQVAGEAVVFERARSEVAIRRSASADSRMHTQSKMAGLVPPPAALGQGKREWLDALPASPPAEFDALQTIPAHEQALALQRGVCRIRQHLWTQIVPAAASPCLEKHLAEARRLFVK